MSGEVEIRGPMGEEGFERVLTPEAVVERIFDGELGAIREMLGAEPSRPAPT